MASTLAARVRELKESLDLLDQHRAEIQAELDEIVEAAGVALDRKRGRPKTKGGRRPIKEGSMLHWAKVVLGQRGRPWYIDDLLKDVQRLSGKPIQKSSLVSSLSRFVRAGDTFTRPQEGYYGLTAHNADIEPEEASTA